MAITKVLIADDTDTDLANLERIVSEAGYTVVSTKSGGEALKMAGTEKPDVVLLDVMMPDLNGFQVCRAIKADPETQQIPVILVSSKGQKTDKIWGQEQGASDYITKPYTADQILRALKAL